MNQGKYVFAQIAEFLNHHKFEDFVARYDGNKDKVVFLRTNRVILKNLQSCIKIGDFSLF